MAGSRSIRAAAPPGWEGRIEKWKSDGSIDNPSALAWYLYDQGADLSIDDQKAKRDFNACPHRERYASVYSMAAKAARLAIVDDGPGPHAWLPNRAPFKAVLHQVDRPSTRPPEGSRGHLVQISAAVARRRLRTILGQGLNVADGLGGHAVTCKIGIITAADIGRDPEPSNKLRVGPIGPSDVVVSGHLFDKDYPGEVSRLRAAARSGQLGASYEITAVEIEDPSARVWQISDFCYTGAAALMRRSAAYEQTSLAANGEVEDMPLSNDEILKIAAACADIMKAEGNPFAKKSEDKEMPLDLAEADAKDKAALAKEGEGSSMMKEADDATVAREAEEKRKAANEAFAAAADLRFEALVLRAPKDQRGTLRAMAKVAEMRAEAKLATDSTATRGGKLATDSSKPSGLATDREEMRAQRKTLSASAITLLAKHGEGDGEGRIIRESVLDQALKAQGMSPESRMAVKIDLSHRRLLVGG